MNNILEFFTSLFESGYSYSSINTAKSALLTIVTVNDSKDWNTNSDIVRFFKGVYNMKTPLPKYSSTWDVDTFLRFLTTLMPLHELSLKHLTLKAVSLIALVSGCRAQSIHEMNIDFCDKTHNKMCFFFKTKLKTSRPSNKAQTLIVYKYTDESLCVYRTLSAYIERTQSLRSSQSLWISWVKPHPVVGRQSISRWLKAALQLCGIDTKTFSGHSTRMASTSKAHAMGVGLTTILQTAGWSSQHNFIKFYKRDQAQKGETFADAVLDLQH